MRKDLYFIPIITDALRDANPKAALKLAFHKIECLGKIEEHAQGFIQFCQFMKEVASHVTATVIIERNDEILGAIAVNALTCPVLLHNILPGNYVARLSTGRVIWEEKLSEVDVLWAKAFPAEELALAADTDLAHRRSTRKEELLDGTMALYVYPGVESGDIGIEIQRKHIE